MKRHISPFQSLENPQPDQELGYALAKGGLSFCLIVSLASNQKILRAVLKLLGLYFTFMSKLPEPCCKTIAVKAFYGFHNSGPMVVKTY